MVPSTASLPADHFLAWLTFCGVVVGALATPATIVVLALVFGQPVRRLLEHLTGVEGWGVKASFDRAEETSKIDGPDRG